MPSGPLREVGAGGLSVYFIQTKSAIGKVSNLPILFLAESVGNPPLRQVVGCQLYLDPIAR